MPNFYLHVISIDKRAEDIEGGGFPDLEAAKQEAREGLCALVAESLRAGTELKARRIEVADEDGKTQAVVTLADALSAVVPNDAAIIINPTAS